MPNVQNESTSDLITVISGKQKLQRKIKRARWSILWEQLWPTIYLPLLIGIFYVALSWLGIFGLLSFWIRIPILLLIVIGFIATLYRIKWVKFPDYEDGLRRVEEDSGHLHRPFSALEDKLEAGSQDPVGRRLWQVHIKRMSESLKRVNTRHPQPNAFKRDPWGLRVAVILLFIVGFSVSEGERGIRLLDAFAGPEAVELEPGRIDVWVNPPTYTGRVPIFLTGETRVTHEHDKPITVPEGSIVVIRRQGNVGDFSIQHGQSAESLQSIDPAINGVEQSDLVNTTPIEHEIELNESGFVNISNGRETSHSWFFEIEPDLNPEIAFEEDPDIQPGGGLQLIYQVTDDYGVLQAEAKFEADPDAPEQFGIINENYKVRSLIEPPNIKLTLPSQSSEDSVAETYRNLTTHPWAGSDVILTLTAEDELGQTGYSKPYKMKLPERFFSKPLARAIIEQRKILALDANQHTNVIDALDAILLVPDLLDIELKYYFGMDFIYHQLVAANSDEELFEVVELLWELALTIEDGDLSLAERALRDAQEALRNALQEGASDEEITRLTQELREALQQYMQAMLQQMRQNPQVMMPLDPNAQSFDTRDLDEMLRQIEELAKSGAREAAEQLLSQMQQMLENARSAQSQQQSGEAMQMMMEALNELGQMIQRQQELMDQTFQLEQPGQRGGIQQFRQDENGQWVPIPQPNQNQSQDQSAMQQFLESLQNLQQQQGNLEQQLRELMQQMQGFGLPPNQSLGDAGNSMNSAEQFLGQQDSGNAVGQQGQALESLRQGAQDLNEQMRNGNGGGSGMRMGGNGRDPLGRSRNNPGSEFGRHIKVPDEIDAQRARQILEELRKRFSDPKRPAIELDYLERLLTPF